MRRFGRWIFNAAAVVSLLICGAAMMMRLCTLLGLGSCTALQGPHRSFILSFLDGQMVFQVASLSPDPSIPASYHWHFFSDGTRAYMVKDVIHGPLWERSMLITMPRNIAYTDGMPMGQPMGNMVGIRADCGSLVVPLWLILLATAVAPVRWLVRSKRRVPEVQPPPVRPRRSVVRSLGVFAPALLVFGAMPLFGLWTQAPKWVGTAFLVFFPISEIATIFLLVVWRRRIHWLAKTIGWLLASGVGCLIIVVLLGWSGFLASSGY